MKVIAFDTSNQPLSVALLEDGQLIGQREANVAKNHSVQLLPFIDELVRDAGWEPADLDRVIVAQGPGSYTGLRIAVTTAKTLAFTLGISLVGVSSLALLAANVAEEHALIVPLMDARNTNLYAGTYHWDDGFLVGVENDRHTNLGKLLDSLMGETKPVVFVGDVTPFEGAIKEALPSAQFMAGEDNLPHADRLWALGRSMPVLTGDAVHTFVPNYHRLSQAEAEWAAKHQDTGNRNYVERV
jgi:tRNA threonylcarbamoyl adenosine modification protein YeaZ